MKKLIIATLFLAFSFSGMAQYRWELTAGIVSSQFNFESEEGIELDTNRGIGFQLNAAYEYILDQRAKSSIVFSGEVLQRKSEFSEGSLAGQEIESFQFGFTPKYRIFFGKHVRGFVNVGPSFRINSSLKINGEKIESDNLEQVIIGGVYGGGVSIAMGEMFDIIAEAGVMNDFVNSISDSNSSKFFDIYARVGVRFRVYDRY
ncbi:hypothetical protein [Aquimarina rhabdastrellae]